MILLQTQTSQFLSRMIPKSLYIHIPWCISKCPYCDFNSHKSPGNLPEMDYMNALIKDLDCDLYDFPTSEIYSIFIGGGTPSLLSPQSFDYLLTELNKRLSFKENIEITLEANPGTVDQQRFNSYRNLGINRLSLGIQSFNAHQLRLLGRIHDATQAHQAIEKAYAAGFANLNIDIMHGLPQQTIETGLHDLETALSYKPAHLSWYQLTIEPNTVFYKQPVQLPDEEITYQLEQLGLTMLTSHDYQRYEISAFSRDINMAAQHNLNYWLFGDYYGIGAGAHGKHTDKQGDVWRTRKQRQPRDYLFDEKPSRVACDKVKPKELVFEYMLNASRLEFPIANTLFNERTGLEWTMLAEKIKIAENKGLLKMSETHWHVTEPGRRFTNDLQIIFLE